MIMLTTAHRKAECLKSGGERGAIANRWFPDSERRLRPRTGAHRMTTHDQIPAPFLTRIWPASRPNKGKQIGIDQTCMRRRHPVG